MDIYLTSPSLQITAVVLILFSAVLSYYKPRFIALLTPIILPLYLVKIYFRSGSFLNFQSYFSPQFSQTPVIRPDLEPALGFDQPALGFDRVSHNLTIPSNLLEILLILFLLINFSLIIRGFRRVWENYWGKFLLISILILLLSMAISTIYAINLRVALGAAKSWFLLPVLLFFALLPLLESSQFRRKMLYSLLISGAVVTFMSVLFFLEDVFTYDGRLAGFYLSPNHLAMALIPGILALIALIKAEGLFSTKTFNLLPNVKYRFDLSLAALLLFELFFLYKTYSYGAWLALIVAAAVVVLPTHPVILSDPGLVEGESKDLPSKKRILPYSLITVFILLILGVSQLGNPKLQHIVNGDYYSSFHSRLMIWNSALLISRDHLLSGIGADNFQQAYLDYQQYFPEPYLEWSAPQPHNVFLAFQTQLGILGLLGFLSLIIFTFFRAGGQSLDPLNFWALAYLVYLILHGLVDTPYMKNDLALIFWIALAVLWGVKNTSKKIPENLDAKV